METKICRTCKTEKTIDIFTKRSKSKDGFSSRCKDCDKKYREEHKEKIKETGHNYYENNKEKLREDHHNYYEDHKEERKEYHRNYRIKNKEKIKESDKNYRTKNKEKIKESNKNYRTKNKEKIKIDGQNYYECNKEKIKNNNRSPAVRARRRKRSKERLKNDFEYNIKINIRVLFRKIMEDYSITGKIKNVNKYGINYEEIINHLGPCPGNRKDYHIDHIFPISAFDHNNPIEIKACWNYKNLRWLLKEENLKKNNKYDKKEFKKYLDEFKKK